MELSRAGRLRVEGRAPADLMRPGTKIGQPNKLRSRRPFCIRVDCVDPVCKFILDTGDAEQHQAWIAALQATTPPNAAQAVGHRYFTFEVSVGKEELRRFTIDYRAARGVHKVHSWLGYYFEAINAVSEILSSDFTEILSPYITISWTPPNGFKRPKTCEDSSDLDDLWAD